MNWSAFVEWLAMGQYGTHVWGAYAFSLVVLAGMAVHAVGRKNRALRSVSEKRR